MMIAQATNNHNVLVTGGAGFIGSNLVKVLYAKGYNITVLDNLSPQIHGSEPEKDSELYKSLPLGITFIKGSVTCKEDCIKAIQNQDIIVHLAAETGTGQSMYEIERYTQVNVIGTSVILDILTNDRQHTVSKFILASSRSIYGEGKYFSKNLGVVFPSHRCTNDLIKGDFEVKMKGSTIDLVALPTDEDSKIHPSSIYGINKQTQEQMVVTICKALGIGCIALRFQNVYGPGQSLRNPYTGILSIFSTLIRLGETINIFEDGEESRDFVYIEDAVHSIVLSIETPFEGVEVFNVGSGIPTKVIDVADTLCRFYQSEVPVHITGQFRIGDIRHNFADLTKINSVLGFEPKYGFEMGIEKFTDWVKAQPIKASNFTTSLHELSERGLLK